ncbi:amino acid adenylation domain-containing protein [Olsenella profusa]|uniref:Amino acid adenylation domain-containing protein n=1 Tax=Olsenella profusa TaxID=138595 RepID=A0ABS2F2K2_9ACTN|nr:amino acid adenylation domain-containing protein [Olsenella profusa]MBM6775211.1 amino acid adenylation domain-containing protein [Olsenella profusa]
MTGTNALLEAVEKNVSLTPDAPAFVEGETGVVTSYRELWDAASHLASGLATCVDGDGPVLVLGHKDALTVAAFLACLMSGHAYVPIDVELPPERVRNIADQIPGATLLATCPVRAELAGVLAGCVLLDARKLSASVAQAPVPDRSSWVHGEQTQYVIFTSGSTGRPKGIEVTATDVGNFMRWLVGFPVVREGGRTFLDQAHYSFDLSEYELVGALATGGCLHAVSPALQQDFRALFDDLASSGVEVWVSTPSFADLCLADPSFDERLLPQVRLFLFCGETLHHGTARRLRERFPQATIANTYGPTESTVAVTYTEIGPDELADSAPLPVGRPRPGTELAICDHETGAELPAGSVGEIVIRGDTVAKGYFRNPEKTAAAFFETALFDGTPCRGYRTGDLGSLDVTGMLRCEGRLDSLVKVNGFRVELGEVEGALAELAGVQEAAVVPVRRGSRVTGLGAFVVLDAASVPTELAGASPFEVARALKAALARTLPTYMVPRQVRVVDELPLTANEKVDRKALAALLARPARREGREGRTAQGQRDGRERA